MHSPIYRAINSVASLGTLKLNAEISATWWFMALPSVYHRIHTWQRLSSKLLLLCFNSMENMISTITFPLYFTSHPVAFAQSFFFFPSTRWNSWSLIKSQLISFLFCLEVSPVVHNSTYFEKHESCSSQIPSAILRVMWNWWEKTLLAFRKIKALKALKAIKDSYLILSDRRCVIMHIYDLPYTWTF